MNPELASIYAPPKAAHPWALEEFLPGVELRYYSFGRRALAGGLRAAGIKTGSRVLLPEFICRDLLSALAAVGAQALFYPVGPDLRPARDATDWPPTQAVLAVNYFGFVQDLNPFQAYAARTGAVLIEDNAHGLFSRDAQGHWLGTRADLGIFSLRKSLPLPNGAALAFPSSTRSWVIPPQEPFRRQNDLRFLLKRTVRWTAQMCGARAAFGALRVGRGLRGALSGRRIPGSDPDSEHRLPLPEAPCPRLAGPLSAADPQEEVRRRRSLYSLFEKLLREAGFFPVFDSLPDGVAPYAFPFRVAPGQEARARRVLAETALEPLPWPQLPSAVAPEAPAHYRDVWLAHFLW